MTAKKAEGEGAAAGPPRWHLDTRLVHGAQRDGVQRSGVAASAEHPGALASATLPPVVMSTAFDFARAEDMEAVFAGREEAPYYSRMGNPTVDALERRVTELCGGAGTLALASGMSAIATGLLGLLRAGDELIASPYLFGGSYVLFTRTLPALGITVHLADPADPAAWEARVGPRTRALFLEALANPAMVVPDLAAFRALAERHGLPLLLDASLLTPLLYDGAAAPADVLFFSATKYLAGPASTIAGLVVDTGRFPWHTSARHDLEDFKGAGQGAYLAKLRRQLMAAVGPCLSPMTAFLLLNGLETLSLRLERQCDNAERCAAFLREHPKVRAVRYPGLPEHPAHALCKAQYRGRFGAVLAFELADKAACFRFLNALRLVRRSTNLGDTRSLALHPASTIYGTLWKHEQEQAGVSERLIRFSLGIEHAADILADLEQALAAA
jgi:O-acetylhomoserine (thiol)-lyase